MTVKELIEKLSKIPNPETTEVKCLFHSDLEGGIAGTIDADFTRMEDDGYFWIDADED